MITKITFKGPGCRFAVICSMHSDKGEGSRSMYGPYYNCLQHSSSYLKCACRTRNMKAEDLLSNIFFCGKKLTATSKNSPEMGEQTKTNSLRQHQY